jgi:alpha-beta hydrolase superfamily lysophospholipase
MTELQEVEFDADGVALRGLFVPAADAQRPAPCVIMAHGLAGEVTHFISDFAEVFADAGLAALVYDHRGWGRSDTAPGMPRNETDPWGRSVTTSTQSHTRRPGPKSTRTGLEPGAAVCRLAT